MSADWRQLNRAYWDERVPIHVAGAFYDVDGWRAGRDNLEPFELDELGDVRGKELVHLQCHFGLDTLSWARYGAQVTGLDFSAPAIETARALAEELGLPARFVQADLYDAPAALGATYDIVYTTHGVLGWLPDLRRWAGVVDALLRPGGVLFLSEYHPVAWMFAEDTLERRIGDGVGNDYFAAEPLEYEAAGTYADLVAETRHNRTVEFQHTLGAVVTAIAEQGLVVEFLHERDFTHFPQFAWLVKGDDRRYHQPEGAPRIPLLYSLRARKPG